MTKTKVNIVAFELKLSKNIGIGEFYDWLVYKDNKKFNSKGFLNYLFVNTHENYIVGSLICFKGDKTLLTTVTGGDKKIIDKIKLKSNQETTQATLFCFDPASQKGMFYSYHGGVGPGMLGDIFKKIHNDGRAKLIKDKAREFSRNGTVEEKHTKRARKYFSGNFEFIVRVTPHDIQTLLKQYREIHAVEISVGPAIDDSAILRPCLDIAKNHRTKININGVRDHEIKLQALKDVYKNITDKGELKAFKLFGRSLLGEPLERLLGENVKHFETLYLDEFIEKLPDQIDWSEFVKSKAMSHLIYVIKNNPAVIPKPKHLGTWKKTLNKHDAELLTE